MKEVALPPQSENIESETFRSALATILELPLEAVPGLDGQANPAANWTISRWLGGFGLGLVPVAKPQSFTWPGPWLGCLRPSRGETRFVVMYGVPSGVVWDPAGDGRVRQDDLSEGFIIAASDIALALPALPEPPNSGGKLEEIWIASSAGEAAQRLERGCALAGRGLEGDRHTIGAGTFPSGLAGGALTLIEAEVCESFDPPLAGNEHRRNLVTRGIDLNALVGSEFTIGDVLCRGVRLCEPCAVVDGYASRPVLRALVHRGGLRADILEDGLLALGDKIEARPHKTPFPATSNRQGGSP